MLRNESNLAGRNFEASGVVEAVVDVENPAGKAPQLDTDVAAAVVYR